MRPGFHLRFRGFDRTEVVAALAKLGSENDEARREIERLGTEIERLRESMAERLGSERDVQRALIAASKVADEIRDHAEEAARQVLRDAEERGQSIVHGLREEARALEGQIDALLVRRREVVASIESFIKVMSSDLEHVRQQQADDSADGTLAKTG